MTHPDEAAGRDARPQTSSPEGRCGPWEIRDRFGVMYRFSWFPVSGESPSGAFSSPDDARRFLAGFDPDPWTLAAFYRVLQDSVAAGRGPDPARLVQMVALALAGGGLRVGPASTARSMGQSRSPGASGPSGPPPPSIPAAGSAPASAIEEAASEPVEPATPREPELSWIEVELVGEDDSPIPGERYRLTLGNGRVLEGSLDAQGRARIEQVTPGSFDLTFPGLDEEAWNRA